MKKICLALLLCITTGVQATHNGAGDNTSRPDERASCNAKFHDGCAQDSGSSVSVSGFAAPVGVLGASLPEVGLLLVMVGFVMVTARQWSRDLGRRARRTPPG